jgi:GTA TIM-barrel-like domain
VQIDTFFSGGPDSWNYRNMVLHYATLAASAGGVDAFLFAFAFVIYCWKVVIWDKVMGLGSTPALSGDVSQWATVVLTAYFGGRSLEKVARILGKK